MNDPQELEKLQRKGTVHREALGYATRLLEHFVAEHFPHNPGWKPLPDLIGVLTQIDNAITIARDYKARLAAAPAVGGEDLRQALTNWFHSLPTDFLSNPKKCNAEFAALMRCIPADQPASPLRGREEIAAFLVARDDAYIAEGITPNLMDWARKQISNGRDAIHSGDCTKESHSCIRCSYEIAMRDADALLALSSSAPPEQPAGDQDKETQA